jgi:uncharacterized membrane protein
MTEEQTQSVEGKRLQGFLTLFILGFTVIFIGIILLMVATLLSNGSINFGAVIFIGPLPIVIGAGPQAAWMVLFTVVLAIVSVLILLILHRELRKLH